MYVFVNNVIMSLKPVSTLVVIASYVVKSYIQVSQYFSYTEVFITKVFYRKYRPILE